VSSRTFRAAQRAAVSSGVAHSHLVDSEAAGREAVRTALEGHVPTAEDVHAADADVAMIRDRPYRKAMSQEDAFDELGRHSGSQFDPAVVSALIACERLRTATSRPLAA
jgi:hypothetical protein